MSTGLGPGLSCAADSISPDPVMVQVDASTTECAFVERQGVIDAGEDNAYSEVENPKHVKPVDPADVCADVCDTQQVDSQASVASVSEAQSRLVEVAVEPITPPTALGLAVLQQPAPNPPIVDPPLDASPIAEPALVGRSPVGDRTDSTPSAFPKHSAESLPETELIASESPDEPPALSSAAEGCVAEGGTTGVASVQGRAVVSDASLAEAAGETGPGEREGREGEGEGEGAAGGDVVISDVPHTTHKPLEDSVEAEAEVVELGLTIAANETHALIPVPTTPPRSHVPVSPLPAPTAPSLAAAHLLSLLAEEQRCCRALARLEALQAKAAARTHQLPHAAPAATLQLQRSPPRRHASPSRSSRSWSARPRASDSARELRALRSPAATWQHLPAPRPQWRDELLRAADDQSLAMRWRQEVEDVRNAHLVSPTQVLAPVLLPAPLTAPAQRTRARVELPPAGNSTPAAATSRASRTSEAPQAAALPRSPGPAPFLLLSPMQPAPAAKRTRAAEHVPLASAGASAGAAPTIEPADESAVAGAEDHASAGAVPPTALAPQLDASAVVLAPVDVVEEATASTTDSFSTDAAAVTIDASSSSTDATSVPSDTVPPRTDAAPRTVDGIANASRETASPSTSASCDDATACPAAGPAQTETIEPLAALVQPADAHGTDATVAIIAVSADLAGESGTQLMVANLAVQDPAPPAVKTAQEPLSVAAALSPPSQAIVQLRQDAEAPVSSMQPPGCSAELAELLARDGRGAPRSPFSAACSPVRLQGGRSHTLTGDGDAAPAVTTPHPGIATPSKRDSSFLPIVLIKTARVLPPLPLPTVNDTSDTTERDLYIRGDITFTS